jgi:hypothetical protein
MNPYRLLIYTAMLSASLAGCTTASYPGPRLPRDEIALARRCGYFARPPLHTSACIQEVDGASVDGNHVEILPGKRQLGIRVITNRSLYPQCGVLACGDLNMFSDSIVLTFQAERGHEYAIRAREADLKEWHVWIEDESTNAVVGKGTVSK